MKFAAQGSESEIREFKSPAYAVASLGGKFMSRGFFWGWIVGILFAGGAVGQSVGQPEKPIKTELSPELRASQERAKKELDERRKARVKKDVKTPKKDVKTSKKAKQDYEAQLANTIERRRQRRERSDSAVDSLASMGRPAVTVMPPLSRSQSERIMRDLVECGALEPNKRDLCRNLAIRGRRCLMHGG
jgi:hypothetical protein